MPPSFEFEIWNLLVLKFQNAQCNQFDAAILGLARLFEHLANGQQVRSNPLRTLEKSFLGALSPLEVHADEKAGRFQMRKFSAFPADHERLYLPLDGGKLLLVNRNGLWFDENGSNEDGVWVEHPNRRAPAGPDFRILADSEQRAISAVNFLADQGASFMKVYNNISERLIATVAAAHSRGLPVTGHVPRVMTMRRAIELGMDGLEHIRITGRELLSREEADRIDFLTLGRRETLLWRQFDVDSVPMNNLASVIAKRRVILDPALVNDETEFRLSAEEVNSEPNNEMLPREWMERLKAIGVPESSRPPADSKGEAAAGFEKRLRFIQMCLSGWCSFDRGDGWTGTWPEAARFWTA